jgi:hypothetical protein
LNLSFQQHVGRKVHGKPKKSRKIARYLFPLTPGYQGPRTKPCKVLDKTLTNFVRCPDPCPRESYGVCPQAQVLGPQNREYSTLNLKPQPTPFLAFLEFGKGLVPNDF